MRSRAPSLKQATTTRLPPLASERMCPITASKTLTVSTLRSAAKLRPVLPPASIAPRSSGAANGVSRSTARSAIRRVHSSDVR